MVPAATLPTAVNTVSRSTSSPRKRPASIGPPEMTTVGMSRRAAAMSMPGMTLSQLGMSTIASNAWALMVTSTESAMISRLASELRMPSWPMAMPSHTPMVSNSSGVPPAMRTPAFTASAILSRFTWPGMISLYEPTTATRGRAISTSVSPMARRRLR